MLFCTKVMRFGGFYPILFVPNSLKYNTAAAHLLFDFFLWFILYFLFYFLFYFILFCNSAFELHQYECELWPTKKKKFFSVFFWEGYNNNNKMCNCKYWQNGSFFHTIFVIHSWFDSSRTESGRTGGHLYWHVVGSICQTLTL